MSNKATVISAITIVLLLIEGVAARTYFALEVLGQARFSDASERQMRAHSPRAPRSNQELVESVNAALERTDLQGNDILIESLIGVCTLHGQIANDEQRASAERMVEMCCL